MSGDPRDPIGYRAVTPYLVARNARAAIAFYRAAFGAEQLLVIEERDGRIGHASLRIGPSAVFLADEHPEFESVVGPRRSAGRR